MEWVGGAGKSEPNGGCLKFVKNCNFEPEYGFGGKVAPVNDFACIATIFLR